MKVYAFLATHIIVLYFLVMGSVFPFAGATAQYMWVTTSPPSVAVSSVPVVTHNGYIYLIKDDGYEYAQINPDGTLGTWTAIGITPDATLRWSAAITIGNNLYLSGGNDTLLDFDRRDVDRYPINPDGSLGTPLNEPSLNFDPINHAHIYYNGFLYAIGGNSPTVAYSRVSSNGSLSPWILTSSVTNGARTSPPTFAWVRNGFIYYFYTRREIDAIQLERAPINYDGSLGTWEVLTTSTDDFKKVAAVVENNLLLISTTGSIKQAPILGNSNIGSWSSVSTQFLGNRNDITVPLAVWDKYVYGVGRLGFGQPAQADLLVGFTSAPLVPDKGLFP